MDASLESPQTSTEDPWKLCSYSHAFPRVRLRNPAKKKLVGVILDLTLTFPSFRKPLKVGFDLLCLFFGLVYAQNNLHGPPWRSVEASMACTIM